MRIKRGTQREKEEPTTSFLGISLKATALTQILEAQGFKVASVVCKAGQTFFVHHTAITSDGFKTLSEGQKVRFKDEDTVISIQAFFLAAYQGCFLIFVSVSRHSVSDSFPYLFCRPCLPLRTSFSRCPSSSRREGAAASSALSWRTFMNIPVRPTREFSHAGRGPATAGMNS
jgi:hypothetical protein